MARASVDGVFTKTATSNTNNIVSISVDGVASVPNDLAIVTAGGFNFASPNGQAPDASWTALGGAFQKILSAAGPLTVTQALSGSFTAAQLLVLFKTVPGQAPAFTVRGSGSGGSVLVSAPATFTPAAGTSLLWMCCQVAQFPNTTSFASDGGLSWVLLANVGIDDGQTHPISMLMWYAENVPANPVTLRLNVGNGGDWRLFEISNLLSAQLRLLASLGVGI